MHSFSRTDIGLKRQMNQDFIFCEENAIGSLPNLYIVADGMGGHKAGDYASRLCIDIVTESIENSVLKTPVGIFEEAINKANECLLQKADEDENLKGMGTTFVAATILQQNMYVANVGDSRLYIMRSKLKQITEDHSLVEEMVRNGEISKKEARFHPNKNIITRALGAGKHVTADYFEVELQEGDIVLLCSDGLSNMVDDEEITAIIKANGNQLKKAVDILVDTANENGGKDNISLIIIKP